MKLKLWQVDAFATKPLEGNPAAVVPLDAWLDASLMQKIANENNLAETAFFVRTAKGRYALRWFTPVTEVNLCGHATLSSAWTIFELLDPELNQIIFETKSGQLFVDRGDRNHYVMSLPTDLMSSCKQAGMDGAIGEALRAPVPREVFQGRENIMAVFEHAADIRALHGPGSIERVIARQMGLIVTAPGDDGYDFISRYFAPHHGIPEDPVTGSAHCALTPYWAKRLGKKTMRARQVSPRGGDLNCVDAGERTILSGTCALYMTAEISL